MTVCKGINNQLTLLGSYDNHYHNLSVREVGGYVLIAINKVATVPLANLRLIRGHTLYDKQYALVVMSNYDKNNTSVTLNYTSGLRQL
ncbi:hypothetical protein CRUP_011800, partial [Coryphaenoides rupestris]